MKIAKIEPLVLRAPYGEMAAYWAQGFWGERPSTAARPPVLSPERVRDTTLWRYRAAYPAHVETTLVRVTTDDGLVGYGESHAPIAPEVAATVVATLLAPLLLGENPLATDRLWEKMYASMRIRGHHTGFMAEAMAGVDIALWDIAGKAAGLPVHLLMGGDYHERVRCYQSHLPVLEPEEMAAIASRHAQQGYHGIKISGGAGPEVDVRNVERIREAVGDGIELMLDAGGVYDVPTASRIGRALERQGVLFFEDPLPPEDHEGYAELCRALDVAIATGEADATRYQFARRLAGRGVDVVLPDVSRSGGLTETRKIATLADVHNVRLCPHNSVCSAVHHAASLQLCAAIPNFLLYEFWAGHNPLLDITASPLALDGGYLAVPRGPGLGIQIDEDKLERLRARA